jgi:SAM-dependent methyltransferase
MPPETVHAAKSIGRARRDGPARPRRPRPASCIVHDPTVRFAVAARTGHGPVMGTNTEQIQFWNESAGPRWVTMQDALDEQIAPLGIAAMDRLAPAAGERIVDVGCGCGQSSLELARRVAPGGTVTGIDVSQPMLARARQRAGAAGIDNVAFVEADAQSHAFTPGGTDAVFSRFGVMFFEDPTAAFTNLARALRADGRLGFVCWQGPQQNPWMMLPIMAIGQHVALPPPPGPEAPGPLSFADEARVRRILGGAGFSDVALEPLEATLIVGGGRASLDEAVQFIFGLGAAAAALQAATPEQRAAAADAVRETFRPYHGPDGVRMSGAAWIVTAKRR